MKRSALVSLAAALVVVGCACPPRLPQKFEERSRPQVTVEAGKIVVQPDPLYFAPREKGDITWQLPENSRLRFPANGITIEGRLVEASKDAGQGVGIVLDREQREIVCKPQGGGRQFTCTNLHTMPGIYKYTIRVRDDSGQEFLRDPFIMNM